MVVLVHFPACSTTRSTINEGSKTVKLKMLLKSRKWRSSILWIKWFYLFISDGNCQTLFRQHWIRKIWKWSVSFMQLSNVLKQQARPLARQYWKYRNSKLVKGCGDQYGEWAGSKCDFNAGKSLFSVEVVNIISGISSWTRWSKQASAVPHTLRSHSQCVFHCCHMNTGRCSIT